jgi:microcystin-dependent protein
MDNLTNLEHTLRHINFSILPYIQEVLFNMSFHVGEYKYSVRTEDFNGWLMCDGRSISRETYPALFDVVGTTFGSPDADHFNLPDFRGRLIAHTKDDLGVRVGEETHTLVSAEMPSHTHTGTANS